MNVVNIGRSQKSFEVLQTTALSQTASMTLLPGGSSSAEPNVHQESDQILFLIEGELMAEVADEKRVLKVGDSCLVPANTPHRFQNVGAGQALTFNVYTPPQYAADEKDGSDVEVSIA